MKKLGVLCSSLLLALMMCFPVFASEDLRYVAVSYTHLRAHET